MTSTSDGHDVRLVYPVLNVIVSRLADYVRKGSGDPHDWGERAVAMIGALSDDELRQLVGDLNQLSEYDEADEDSLTRLVSGMGWSKLQVSRTDDDQTTFVDVIQNIVHNRFSRSESAKSEH